MWLKCFHNSNYASNYAINKIIPDKNISQIKMPNWLNLIIVIYVTNLALKNNYVASVRIVKVNIHSIYRLYTRKI